MGLVVDIVRAENAFAMLPMKDQDQVYQDAAEAAFEKLDPADKKIIKGLIYELSGARVKDVRIKNFGPVSAREVLMKVGIVLATMPEKEFEKMLNRRRA